MTNPLQPLIDLFKWYADPETKLEPDIDREAELKELEKLFADHSTLRKGDIFSPNP
jgi:hypothetical protein